MTIRVAGIFVKPRTPGEYGLPKGSVPAAEVTADGLAGDFNNYRQERLSGDPDSAVMLLTQSVVDELQSAGWPVRPGDLGENLLLEGGRYEDFQPTRDVRIGDRVLLRTSRPCKPCHRLASLPYVGADGEGAFLKAVLHRRGWYARVLFGGPVRVGDAIELL